MEWKTPHVAHISLSSLDEFKYKKRGGYLQKLDDLQIYSDYLTPIKYENILYEINTKIDGTLKFTGGFFNERFYFKKLFI